MDKRAHERLAVAISGNGVLRETGQPFSFEAVDFSVMGMQMQIEGPLAAQGQQVALEFEVNPGGLGATPVSLVGEVVRLVAGNFGTRYGVKWLETGPPESLETLEAFYTERFFETVS